MIEVTDEMLAAFREAVRQGGDSTDDIRAAGIAAVLAIVERQHQQEVGDAYQRGWWRGQHRLCPRCGVELEREVAAERQERES